MSGPSQIGSSDAGGELERLRRIERDLEERRARERRFVAYVSHELRTPLTALQTAAEILVAHADAMPPVAREAAELVADRSTHLVRLVHELLELTELDAGSAPIRWEPVDPRAVLTAVLARRGRTMPIEGEGVTTHADKARLERILGNLVDNAFEHADGRGVGASIRVDDGEVLIAVTDEGPGIPEGDVPFLFESFYKGDRSRRAHRGGIGMGLPIAYENARLLGADIAVDSEVGRGSTFTLRLPIRESPPAGGSDER